MKKRKRKPRKTSIQRAYEPREETGPTPELKARGAEPDAIQWLIDNRMIDSAGERAALSIEQIWKAVNAKTGVKGNQLSPVAHGEAEMSDSLAIEHATVYVPWSRNVGPEAFKYTITVVLERILIDQMDIVAEALKNYARRL